ncbi:hypothetical protein KI387_041633, partial [Taxus chinensis]
MFVIGSEIPVAVSSEVTKDKKETVVRMKCETCLKLQGFKSKYLVGGLHIHIVDREQSYTLRSETVFHNFENNKTTAGIAITSMGSVIAAGMKLEDKLKIGEKFELEVNAGTITGGKDVEYGATLRATYMRNNDFPSSLALSFMDKRQGGSLSGSSSIMEKSRDLHILCRLQSQLSVGQNTTIIPSANLNNRGAGVIRLST